MNLSLSPNLFLLSLPVAAFWVYVPYLVVALARVRLAQSLDDPMEAFAKPRALSDRLPDYARRANWAHQNSLESFPLYAAAAIAAYLAALDSTVAYGAVAAYLIARLLFCGFYILNIPPLRSLMFGVGSLSIFGLYIMSCKALWF